MWAWFLVFAARRALRRPHRRGLRHLRGDRRRAVSAASPAASPATGSGAPETTVACMAVSGLCALSIGLAARRAALAVALVWGFTVVADSAQFSTLVTEHADQAYVGTALTLQLAVGFTLTVATIWLVPYLDERRRLALRLRLPRARPGARHRRDAPAQDGSVTTSRSPSSSPRRRAHARSRTATAAPRSFSSSPSTIGAAAGVDRRDLDPRAARRRPRPRRRRGGSLPGRAPRASARPASASTCTGAPSPAAAGTAARASSSESASRSDRVVAAALDPRRQPRARRAARRARREAASIIPSQRAVVSSTPSWRSSVFAKPCTVASGVRRSWQASETRRGKSAAHGVASVTAWPRASTCGARSPGFRRRRCSSR